jgi:ferritin-like metal-binding protein YciE
MERGIRDLFIEELYDSFSSERQIVEALPELIAAADSADLREAFESHLKETKEQVQRLENIFNLLKVEKKEKFCKGTKGLIEECKQVLEEFKTKSPIRDAALISKAQRIEHYEISAYGTSRTFAKELDLDDDIVDLLDDSLAEEKAADKALTKIAEGGLLRSGINHLANTSKR